MADEVRAEGVGPALGGTGSPCPTLAHEGRVYKVGHPTQAAKEWFELLVAQYHEESLESRRRVYAAATYRAKAAALETKLGAGEHRVFGELWTAVVDGPDSVPVLLCSFLQEHQEGTPVAVAKAMWATDPDRVRAVLALLIPSFAAVLVAGAPIHRDEKAAKAREVGAFLLRAVGVPTSQGAPTE